MIAYLMDVHVQMQVTNGLRLRGVDVLTAQQDESDRLSDSDLLDRANALRRVLFTFDEDLLVESSWRQRAGIKFAGVVFAHYPRIAIGQCVNDLYLMAQVFDSTDMQNRVEYLPIS